LVRGPVAKFSLLIGFVFGKIWHRIRKDHSKGAPMKVKEIMTTKVNTLSPEMNAREALGLLFKMKISGLPVIDENNKLVGMFTEKGVLRTLLPGYIAKVGSFTYQENPKMIKQKVDALQTMQVKDVMRQEVITVDEETALSEVARIMLTQLVRRVPVLNKDKQVIGIVAREDVVRALFSKEYN
jgi:predicted transcriptional regulator